MAFTGCVPWTGLAVSALALMVVAPTLVISALLVLEAVLHGGQRNVEALHVERPGTYYADHTRPLDGEGR